MSSAICMFRKVIYCWDDEAPALLVPCPGPHPNDLSLPVCLCDQGRLTGPGTCLCSYRDLKCETLCTANGDACGQQPARFGDLSDYLKVLLGLVTFLFFVSFYIACKRFVRRRYRRSTLVGDVENAVYTISGNQRRRNLSEVDCNGADRWFPHGRSEPPNYDEVNSVPPPYELAVKRAAAHTGKAVGGTSGCLCDSDKPSPTCNNSVIKENSENRVAVN